MATTYRTGDRVQIQAPISRSPLGSAVIIEQGKKNPEIFHVRQEWDNRTGWVHIGRMHPATDETSVIADAAMDNGICQPATYNVTVCNERGEHVFSTVWTFKATDAAAVAAQQRLLVSRSHRLIAHHGAHHVVIGGNGTIRTIHPHDPSGLVTPLRRFSPLGSAGAGRMDRPHERRTHMEDTRPTTDRTREQEYDKAIYAAKSGQRHPIDHQRIAYFHTKSYAEQLTASSAYARLNDEEWQSFLKRTR